MENPCDSLQHTINDLFFIDDLIPCLHQPDAFKVTGVYEDRIAFRSADNPSDELTLDFSSLDVALKDVDASPAIQAPALLRCFIAEYLERVEQARRDEEVDAMWRSAIVCQIQ